MPEHLRALVVILSAAALVFWVAERPVVAIGTAQTDYLRRRNAWFAVTLIGFLAHDYWLYASLCFVLVAVLVHRDSNPLALYCLLFFAIPMYSMDLPGIGPIEHVLSLDHVRILNLAILLPTAIAVTRSKHGGQCRLIDAGDVLVLLYIGYMALLQAAVVNFTSTMRAVISIAIDVWLPYVVASRSLRDPRAWREVISAFIIAAAVMAVMAPFETLKGWLLYGDLGRALGVPSSGIGVYLTRGDGGLLRANGAVGNAIVLGYVMMVALLLFTYIAPLLRPRFHAALAAVGLAAGLFSALSRGPWVGAAVGLLVALSFGTGAGKRIGWLLGATLVGCMLLALIPGSEKIIDYLPFVGNVDAENVSYRQRLVEVSMTVFWQNPLFGSLTYIVNPVLEEMRQGQGIIDIVNSYLAVALAYGGVGLVLFLAPFMYALWVCWRARSHHAHTSAEIDRLGRALLGAMIAVLITIATVSSISVVAPIYWMLAGLCVGYARMLSTRRASVTDHAPTMRMARRGSGAAT